MTHPSTLTSSDQPSDAEPALVEDTISGLLRAQVRQHPDVVALVATSQADEGRRWTCAGGRIVDPGTCEVQPLGMPGEVRVRGQSQMIGYLDDPRAAAAVVDADGWLRTGDLGIMDEHDMIKLLDRRIT